MRAGGLHAATMAVLITEPKNEAGSPMQTQKP